MRQITSPHLADLTVKVDMACVVNGYAVASAAKMSELAQSLTTGTLAATHPHISFVVQPRSDWTPEEAASELGKVRDVLFMNLSFLRNEGRLRIMRSVIDL